MRICEKSVTSTGSNISHLKIAKQHNRDEVKVYTKNIYITLKNVENVEKLFLIGKNKKKLRLHEYFILQRC